MKPSTILKTKGWTQEVSARNASGGEVPPSSPDAVCFCLFGAINLSTKMVPREMKERILNNWTERIFDKLQERGEKCIAGVYTTVDIISWNDQQGRTKEEAINLLEEVGL